MLLGAGLCGVGLAHAASGAVACAGPGRAVTGGVHWGARCVNRWQGEDTAASRPALQGSLRARRQLVGVRGGDNGVSGRGLAGRWWWASGCAMLLRRRNAGETASLRDA